jgi:glycosyltransferase involved in cell wall biosynthesis
MLGPNIYRVRLPGPPEPDALFRKDMSDSPDEIWMSALDALRRHAGIERAVSLVEFPNWAGLAASCRGRMAWKIVYDCLDEHTGFANPWPGLAGREMELIEGSDMVVATSRPLYEKVSRSASRALLLPNAADYDHFKDPGAARPLRGISRPIIGYFGAIAEWFDVEMVATAARRHKDWQFVLIGGTHGADLSSINRLRNVNLLGELPYAELPGYLHEFDAAIIPFRLTPLTVATNPVKFYEYLSAGKPVVSVRLPELEPFKDLYYPAGTGAEFVSQIEAALCERSPEKAEARKRLARANTWLHRYEQLSDAIQSI